MSKSKKNEISDNKSLNHFELESFMNFQEMPLDVAIKKLKESGILVLN